METKLDKIYRRGMQSLDDFYAYRPTKVVSSLIRGDDTSKDENAASIGRKKGGKGHGKKD